MKRGGQNELLSEKTSVEFKTLALPTKDFFLAIGFLDMR